MGNTVTDILFFLLLASTLHSLRHANTPSLTLGGVP
jgi:hypothetical protein